jgi:hypothetical protein
MGYEAKSKILEKVIIDLGKKHIEIPVNILSDLQSARSLLKIQNIDSRGAGETEHRIDEYLGNVEAFVISEAEKVFPPERVEQWLATLDMAMTGCRSCGVSCQQQKEGADDRFITGVPRDQRWVRVKPIDGLSVDKIEDIAAKASLGLKREANDNILVYGTKEQIGDFIKQITNVNGKQKSVS